MVTIKNFLLVNSDLFLKFWAKVIETINYL